METIRLTDANIGEAAAQAAEVLAARGVILYPTDTLYGLGADAFSDEAVAKVYAIKGRDEKKPIHCIVESIEKAGEFAEVNELAQKLAEKFLPGSLTLILGKRQGFSSGIARGIDTIGIRIPDSPFCTELAKRFGPYTTTSANASGAESPRFVDEILAQLGVQASLIDMIIDAGELAKSPPSTVVDVSGSATKVLREGAISAKDLGL